MAQSPESNPLRIAKYSNRRYYDRTRSRHLTQREIYELVRGGQEVRIVDSKTGQDITNVVLLQLMIERDTVKTAMIPSSGLHWLIRCDQRDWQSLLADSCPSPKALNGDQVSNGGELTDSEPADGTE